MPSPKENKKYIDPQIEQRFNQLKKQWKSETVTSSNMTEIVTNQHYQEIIKMGDDVLPILFKQLIEAPDHYFWALRVITETDPTNPKDAGKLQKMANSWLKWASDNDYL
jgi:hypothetical protein